MTESLHRELRSLYLRLRKQMREKFDRHVSFGDLFSDRWETAADYQFGEGSSCYDNVLVLGEVKVGSHTWVGPGVVLDGSGGLTIGDHCSISAGVQIYSHDTVKRSTSLGEKQPEQAPTQIGSGVYIGPNTIIEKGVTIGDRAVIGAMSLVRHDVPASARAWGVPAEIQNCSDDEGT